jgi:hypothetical protein
VKDLSRAAPVLPEGSCCQQAKNRAEILNQNQRVAGAPEEIRTPDPQIRSFKVQSDLGGHSPTYGRKVNYDPQSFLTLGVIP